MLPEPIYEALPYAYLLVAAAGLWFAGPDPQALVCAAVLVACALRIMHLRRDYRVRALLPLRTGRLL